MRIFLAGGVSGNLRDFWQKVMNIYLAAPHSRSEVVDEMKVYQASLVSSGHLKDHIRESMSKFLNESDGSSSSVSEDFVRDVKLSEMSILESFYYLRKNEEFMALAKHFGSFLLDSGAFTFMTGAHKGAINWDEYVEEYARFINKHDIKLFFELDIDSVVGLQEVERLREKLEALTGKKPIPVWHKNRGKEYFIKMCENYPYVALGGIVTKEIPRQKYEKGFPWFIKTAHLHHCKIHGLGYTTILNLPKYHFDSVDSTAWLYGNRGGYLYKFNPSKGTMDQLKADNARLKSREGAVNNFREWVKLCKYAEANW
jgi:hypothetical protein